MHTVSIIGAGRIGGALALALDARNDYTIENLIVRDEKKKLKLSGNLRSKPQILNLNEAEKIVSEIVFICTQDAEIEKAADILALKLTHRPLVFHTSGALSSEILHQLKKKNCPVGSIHPLISVSDPMLGAEKFRAAYFCVEGENRAVEAAKRIVGDLGGVAFSIDTEYKILYHAAAVMSCGHLVALLDASFGIMEKCGLDGEKAKQILFPLIKSTLTNLERQTSAAALTGTFARADVETFRRHLDALRSNVTPEILEIYLLLGQRSLSLTEKQGARAENIELIQKELLLAKKKLK